MLMRSPLARERRRPAGFILPCQPTLSDTVPSGPLWLHEIKHDGYRIMARKERRQRPPMDPQRPGLEPPVHRGCRGPAGPAELTNRDRRRGLCPLRGGLPDFRGGSEAKMAAPARACSLSTFSGWTGWGLAATAPGGAPGALADDLRRRPAVLRLVEHLDGDGAEIFAPRLRALGWRASSRSAGMRVQVGPEPHMAQDQEPRLRAAMTEVRCLFCLHWRPDDENPEATEREFQMRFGPEVGVAGPCGHPENGGR